jgi:hypothetical protein
MQNKIDYAKLLGFAAVSDRLSGDVDFQDETISAKGSLPSIITPS